MKTLIYNNKVEFDDFQLYREAKNSRECEYGYPQNDTTIEEWEEADVYICPHCIKKYGLYEETETSEKEIEGVIKSQLEGNYDYYDLTCGVKGCQNKDSFDGWLSINKCKLKDVNIFRYAVKLDDTNPMYGSTGIIKKFGDDKKGAIKWARENGRHLGVNSDLVYVEESEYASERNLEKDFTLYRRHIWSGAFHGYEEKWEEIL